MENKPLVSILMNCYNGEKYLKEAIDSIYAQTYDNWEIIFIDNCSVDGSAEIAKSYDGRLKYYKTEKNISLGAARNWGLQFVKDGFLAFLDTDDMWMPNKLDIQLSKMLKSDNIAISYTSSRYINESGATIEKRVLSESEKDLFVKNLKKYQINMQSVVINTQVVSKQDLKFDTSLKFAPDFDTFMSIIYKYRAMAISDVLVKYRVHQNSLGKKIKFSKYGDTRKVINEFLKTEKDKTIIKYLKARKNRARGELHYKAKNKCYAFKFLFKASPLSIKYPIKAFYGLFR